MSHRHGKGTLSVAKGTVEVIKKIAFEWKEHNGFRYPFPSIDTNGGEDRDVLELQIRGKVVKAFLRGGKFGHTLKIECNDDDICRVKEFIMTEPRANEAGYKWPISDNIVTMSNKEEGESEFKPIWDGRDININDIAQRQRISSNYIQKDTKVYVEFVAIGYTARKDHGSSLKFLSVGLLDDGTAGYNFESPSKKQRTK
jgi:hypothetical protein